MNAVIESTPVAPREPVASPHPTHKFKLLLRREFWEHKGGFLWAPLVAGGISLLLTAMAIVVGEVVARRAGNNLQVHGDSLTVNGLDLGEITSKLDAKQLHDLGNGIDISLLMASSWPFIVLAFVVFFYCLGALYDERKDRSVLFWKSLPVSDSETVLSKTASALLVAPVLAVAAGLATMLGFLLVISVVVALHGGNPFTLVWGTGSPFAIAGNLLASIPVYALWALPTAGWLLLCSAWAKSKPFLWAIMIPVFSGIFVSWVDLMNVFNLESGWFWQNVVARALLSMVPGSWLGNADLRHMTPDSVDRVAQVISPATTWSMLLTPELWIGAVVGAAMIFAAIQLRRRRELAD
jgi:ABC-2 type transport system permease protein